MAGQQMLKSAPGDCRWLHGRQSPWLGNRLVWNKDRL